MGQHFENGERLDNFETSKRLSKILHFTFTLTDLLLLYVSLKWRPDQEGNVLEQKGGCHRQVQAPIFVL